PLQSPTLSPYTTLFRSLPAFAATVVAAADTRIALPEIKLGLIPGAGGTVSLPRRIGRHRAAYLALSGATIGTETAIGWGLVDGRDRKSTRLNSSHSHSS